MFQTAIFPSEPSLRRVHQRTEFVCQSLRCIGDQVFDLEAAAARALLDDVDDSTYEVCQESCLNPLMGLGRRGGQRCGVLSFIC